MDEKFTIGFSVGNDATSTWNETFTVFPAVIVPIFTPFDGSAPLWGIPLIENVFVINVVPLGIVSEK